ncbi:MAG: transcription-repair coupling factor, partial [Verrucomicrobia bacterium]|nr:transcription-repair coupling factor [Verrucomicrobiota bacterium]
SQILSRLAAGDIDIIIGTHRLVQSDIRFKDLGLFIVDEEQRFGVQQKEKIKKLKALTDVLTLTATPIPRTLYMALAGVKAMSCIETPPQERLPVKTTVCQYDERVIRDAIQRELNRQGQVFFLHNRVTTIETMERKLHELVPHARIAVGHGQMETEELEKVMASFVNGEVDILLSTTIIESGLDIPNANTIIIDRADRFGLSELYQLRGRVGRYRNQAYAYLLIPRHGALLADARKRISAIKQYSRLGSGFKIAMRDLEIRGAGNILGAEQSGHISAIGFDLYCRLLQTSIDKLKGVPPSKQLDTQVDLDFLLADENEDKLPGGINDSRQLIPVAYISDPVQRLEIYRQLAQAKELDTLDTISAELKDRFGKQPPRIQYLIDVHRIRVVAGKKNISAIESQENKIIITRGGIPIMVYGRYPQFTKKTTKGRLKELLQMVQNMA